MFSLIFFLFFSGEGGGKKRTFVRPPFFSSFSKLRCWGKAALVETSLSLSLFARFHLEMSWLSSLFPQRNWQGSGKVFGGGVMDYLSRCFGVSFLLEREVGSLREREREGLGWIDGE